ncbi:IS3 family transposase [Pseudonocardia humida]|uniref:IS3 family transposase n=1 Tax=Pseudonocardia humida TaxID=2800819 RepID=A0ABT1A1Z5_9PSEU|nr:IS3 family transposase [Pseudonocardia humida]MCO1657028.1 IS3 family transposase [Pseudonocardia humida]
MEEVRVQAGMPTTRFCSLIGAPERAWRRHQARARVGASVKGPWPRPVRARAREPARRHALAHPAWGHRKVWAMCRHDGLVVSLASVLRLLRDEGLLLEAAYQRERRQLAARRTAAFAVDPTGANQVWQLDFTEFETTAGGTWRLAGCGDYWSKYELGWHVSPTANQHDAIAAIQVALVEAQRPAGAPLVDLAQRDADGAVQPVVTIVTDNGGFGTPHRTGRPAGPRLPEPEIPPTARRGTAPPWCPRIGRTADRPPVCLIDLPISATARSRSSRTPWVATCSRPVPRPGSRLRRWPERWTIRRRSSRPRRAC